MGDKSSDEIREIVREAYGRVATSEGGCCGPASPSCCDPGTTANGWAKNMGYSSDDVACAPEGANMGLGCGNPQAIAQLQPGDHVVDLGSGGGFDCFLAAKQVGDTGAVVGVDMTSEMVAKARENARKGGFTNVSFRLGEIEHLPVADQWADVILSNCVINLSPDKPQVYRDAFRVLKPGGRLAISDVVLTAALPEELRNDAALLSGCVAGAATIEELESILREVGFEDVAVRGLDESRELIRQWMPELGLERYVLSARVEARKPRCPACRS